MLGRIAFLSDETWMGASLRQVGNEGEERIGMCYLRAGLGVYEWPRRVILLFAMLMVAA